MRGRGLDKYKVHNGSSIAWKKLFLLDHMDVLSYGQFRKEGDNIRVIRTWQGFSEINHLNRGE
ncbi:hypothetical protein DVH24_039929 [Malus domestica]|uniref:Uncharacterized protein n=1 Tax=Malus domestica TaxID=3750 RepID=A0A498I2C5_MALDO|nr:hypothetical protein DVH24_039929 [Malus domestica]